jgi:sugar phosphate isomerase/epimerase
MVRPVPARERLRPGDLVAAHYLLARCDRHGVARIPFADRVEAAGAAGFAGIGIQPADDARSKANGLTDDAMADVLARNGVVLAEIDGAPWWPPDRDSSIVSAQDEVLRLGERFGVRLLNAAMPTIDGDGPTDADLAAGLARLADRAASVGMLVGFEFLPWTSVRDVVHADAIVSLASHPNLGVTVDVWHHSVSGAGTEALAAVPERDIVSVQVTDGVRDPSLSPLTETMVGRRLPGQGELPVADVLRTLHAIGVRTPYSVEIVSLPHRHLALGEWAALAGASVRQAVADAAAFPD